MPVYTRYFRLLTVVLVISALFAGCASQFPTPDNTAYETKATGPNGKALFALTFNAHGGQAIDTLNDVNVSITGQWKTLITKIQPLVTDYTYRVDSAERLLLKPRAYAAFYTGPAGHKKVFRTEDAVQVFYNGDRSELPDVLSSTALTADAFILFLLGPLALERWQGQFIRLADAVEQDKTYYRIYLDKQPGFGFSQSDGLVLWINQENSLTEKVQITLKGHSTTRRAHVQVDYLGFTQVGDFIFPSEFFEKVNAPIAIDAHAWRLTGIDINRGLVLEDLNGKRFSAKAQRPATDINQTP